MRLARLDAVPAAGHIHDRIEESRPAEALRAVKCWLRAIDELG